MPLYPDSERLIRGCFSMLKRGKRPRYVAIGELTEAQLAEINAERATRKFKPIKAALLFDGYHVYKSRILQDGYTEDDVIAQIQSALADDSEVKLSQKMTALRNRGKREDGYGSKVNDEAVLECSIRYPSPILFSTIPKGDKLPLASK
jgi:hypothetical protein